MATQRTRTARVALAASLSRLAILVCVLTYLPKSVACSCLTSVKLAEKFERASAVFSTEIVSVTLRDVQTSAHRGKIHRLGPIVPQANATFDVLEIFKGVPTFSGLQRAEGHLACNAELVEGEQYLVFASEGGKLKPCSGTRLLRRTQHYVEAMRRFNRADTAKLEEPWSFQKMAPLGEGSVLCGLSKWDGSISFQHYAGENVIDKQVGPVTHLGVRLPDTLSALDETFLQADSHLLPLNAHNKTRRDLGAKGPGVIELASSLAEDLDFVIGPLVQREAQSAEPVFWTIEATHLGQQYSMFLDCLPLVDALRTEQQQEQDGNEVSARHSNGFYPDITDG